MPVSSCLPVCSFPHLCHTHSLSEMVRVAAGLCSSPARVRTDDTNVNGFPLTPIQSTLYTFHEVERNVFIYELVLTVYTSDHAKCLQ